MGWFPTVVPVQTQVPSPLRGEGEDEGEVHPLRGVNPNSTTTAHCAIAPPVATLFTYVVPANLSVVPAKAQVPSPLRGEGEDEGEPQPGDNCPLRHSPADCYIVPMRRLREIPPSLPRRRSDPLALWERVRVRVRECNEMQPNATELKVSPLLSTPGEANQGHNQGQLAHRRSPLPLGEGQGEGCTKRGRGGLIFSLAARNKRGQTGPNRARGRPPCPPSPATTTRDESK